MADGFKTDNMTVNEILNLDYETLHSFDTRDISRALRTVSLAANKRINRLLKQSKKTKEGYVPKKSASYNIATDALNAITDDGKKKVKFGVKSAKTRNEMIKQINDIRKFMNMKTSTVSGAVKVRKEREKRLFGKTREQAGKGLTVKQKAELAKQYSAAASNAYSVFRKFLEHEGIPNSPYQNFAGSETILNLIGNAVSNGESDDSALNEAIATYNNAYVQQQEEWIEATQESDMWTELNEGWNNE